ncbi:uncharacterized protein DEA37_0004546 [Paragonimus westermani]|uniref:Uncharacterized protein n=1 Tax=Paragonimus westermani TaxID=34504 RepID=A0A5J4P067_9TREM|nr:uncharacterized protein DEA37_0004546 [Paragonimus westermani]
MVILWSHGPDYRTLYDFPHSTTLSYLQIARQHPTSENSLNNEHNSNWVPIGLTGVLLLATWLANCILLGGALQTAGSGRIVPVAYFFVGSQAIAALLHVTLNLPPAVVGLLFDASVFVMSISPEQNSEEFLKKSIWSLPLSSEELQRSASRRT